MKTIPLAALVLALGAGCAANPPPPPAGPSPEGDREMFVLRAGSARVHARIGPADIVGPEVNLTRYRTSEGTSLRGMAYGRPVLVSIEGDAVRGVIGAHALSLDVERQPRALAARGVVVGNVSRLHLDDEQAKIRLGNCSYELGAERGLYAGRRSCGGSRQQIRLYLPPSLEQWNEAERAAVLAVLLTRQS